MRLKIPSRRRNSSIGILQFRTTPGTFPAPPTTAEVYNDDTDGRNRWCKIPVIPSSAIIDATNFIGGMSPHITVRLPKSNSRRSKDVGWERLIVEGGDGVMANDFAAWLIWHRGRKNPPSILVNSQPDTANFMAGLIDSVPWQDLALAGTHDSSAFFGYPYAQCQQPATSIARQLNDGIRSLDLRMRVVEGELISELDPSHIVVPGASADKGVYHGIRPQRASFTSVLAEIHDFLTSHPSESILVSVKEEVPPEHPSFASLVWTAMAPHVDQFWFLETRLPTLGEVRGRAMLMPRFPIPELKAGLWDKGVGLQLASWPDDDPNGFELPCGNERIRVQDWYGVPSFLRIPEKLEAVIDLLEPTMSWFPIGSSSVMPIESMTSVRRPLSISYLSAATIPLAPPYLLAKGFGWPHIGLGVRGLNSRFTHWLLEVMCGGMRVRGIVPVDFYSEVGDIAGLLIAMNQLGMGASSVQVEERVRRSEETLVSP